MTGSVMGIATGLGRVSESQVEVEVHIAFQTPTGPVGDTLDRAGRATAETGGSPMRLSRVRTVSSYLLATCLIVAVPAQDAKRFRFERHGYELSAWYGDRPVGFESTEARLEGDLRITVARLDHDGLQFLWQSPFGAYGRSLWPYLDKWRNDPSLIASEWDRKILSGCDRGAVRSLVAAGDHALAVVDWVNSSLSAEPTKYQYLVSLSADGKVLPLRPLRPPPGEFMRPLRLLKADGKLFLHDGARIDRIDAEGKTIEKVADVPLALQYWPQFASGRYLVFTPGEWLGPEPFEVIDPRTYQRTTFGAPAGEKWSPWGVDPLQPYLLFAIPGGFAVRSVSTGKFIKIAIDLSAVTERSEVQIWNGFVVVVRDFEGRVYSAKTGKLLRKVDASKS